MQRRILLAAACAAGLVLSAGSATAQDITPIVECVTDNGDGTFDAVFGYENREGEEVEIPIGGNNKITGGGLSGQDQGQPTTFEFPAPGAPDGRPGRTSFDGLFSVEFDGSQLVWRLADGGTATASSNTRACPTPPAPEQKISPVLECVVDNGDQSFTARFGYSNPNSGQPETFIPIGNQNKFTGGGVDGFDQGQPTNFFYPAPNNVPGQPGRTSYAGLFEVVFNGSNLVWTLNGKTTTASSGSEACPEGCDASARPSWDSGELISNGDGTGYIVIDSPNGFLQVQLLTESSANIALVGLQDASGNPITEVETSGSLTGSLGSGFTSIKYTGSGEPDQVRVVVRQLEPGTSSFMFRVTDRCKYSLQVDPVVNLSGATSASPAAEGAFSLHTSRPNPFRTATTIAFTLPERADVTLRVYDVLGREVATLAEGSLPAGGHEVEWDGRDAAGASVSAGVYVYRLDAGSLSATRRVTVLR